MKFSTGVLALFTLTTASALSIPKGIFKRDDKPTIYDDYDYNYLGYNPIFPVKKECNAYIEKLGEEYKDCVIDIIDLKQDEICKALQTKKCQKYYKLRIADAPECKDSLKTSVAGIDSLRRLEFIGIQSACITDENNKYCSFNSLENISDENLSRKDEKELIEMIKKETCKSKKCTRKYLDMVNDIEETVKNYAELVSKYKTKENKGKEEKIFELDEETIELVKYFKSEQCASQATTEFNQNKKETQSSTNVKENNKMSL